MLLNYFRPRIDLVDYVRTYYYYATPIKTVQPLCAELGNIRILLNGGGRVSTPTGEVIEISSAFLLGPTMGAYSIECDPGTRVFGIGVRPRGWGVLMGVDASELANRTVDLSALAGKIATHSIEVIANASTTGEMAAAADEFFSAILDKKIAKACAYPEALEHWLNNPGDLDLDRLMVMMDKSQRQTDRLANQFFGASPKRLQRKYRTLRAADVMRSGVHDWRIAAGVGIYDQAHFIREFKAFVGVTPGQFTNHQASLIEAVQDRRFLGDKPLPLATI